MKSLRFAIVGLCLAAGLTATACNNAAPTTNTDASNVGRAEKTFKLAFVTNNASDFWTIARKGVEKADA